MTADGSGHAKRGRGWGWLAYLALPLLLAPIVVAVGISLNEVKRPDEPVPSELSVSPPAVYSKAAEEGRALARALIVEQNLPSVSVAVGIGGDIVWAESFGWADVERRVPATPLLRYRVGTASKALTSAAVGLLHERRRLDLDASVRRYVPAFPEKEWPVTTRQVMGHIGGVRQHGGEGESMPRRHCTDVTDGLDLFSRDRLRFQPGTSFHFSTYGWILVSAAAQTAARESIVDFMQREIFTPLGMTRTAADIGRKPVPDRVSFYFPRMFRQTEMGLEDANRVDYSCFSGAGAFVSTPSDLVRFGLAILNGTLLKPATTAMLQSTLHLDSGKATDYGLGWQIETVPGAGGSATLRVLGHAGSSVGGTTSFMTFPDHGAVVSVTSNVTFAEGVAPLAAKLGAMFVANADKEQK